MHGRLCAGKYFKRERRRDPRDMRRDSGGLPPGYHRDPPYREDRGGGCGGDRRGPAAGGCKPSGLHEHVGADPEIFPILEAGFDRFLDQAEEDGGAGEYLLPDIIDSLLRAGKVRVKVLWSHEQWLGVTYQEDKAWVERALQKIRRTGNQTGYFFEII